MIRNCKLYEGLWYTTDEVISLKVEVPDVDFRTQIAEELTRQELIDRLCEYHERIGYLKEALNSEFNAFEKCIELQTEIKTLKSQLAQENNIKK